MIQINEHIAYLLQRNDCVIVPQWGAFLVRYEHAHYDSANSCWIAPKRVLCFNPDISHNDGLLVSSLSRRENITYEESLSVITETVAAWKRYISEAESITLLGVGAFRSNDDGCLIFSPEKDSYANAEYHGLPLIKLARYEAVEQSDSSKLEVAESTTFDRLGHNYLMRIAASVAIIVCVIAGLLNVGQNFDKEVRKAALSDFNLTKTEKFDACDKLSMSDNRELKIKRVSDEFGTAKFEERMSVEKCDSDQDGNKYYLVVASLASKSESEKFLASAKMRDHENNFEILVSDKRWRVYIKSAPSFELANDFKKEGQNSKLYPDAWVYVKR